MASIFRAIWKSYNIILARHPVTSKAVTAGSLYYVGDVICQYLEHYQRKAELLKSLPNTSESDPNLQISLPKLTLDWKRSLRMAAFGFGFIGPFSHYFYRTLDKRLPGNAPRTIALKVLADQTIFSFTYLPLFFIFEDALQGKSWPEMKKNVKERFLPTYIAELAVWPAAQTFNFWLVPPSQRVLYISVISIGWNAYLSRVQHGHH